MSAEGRAGRYQGLYVTLTCGHKRRVQSRNCPKDYETVYRCLATPSCGEAINWVRYNTYGGRAGATNPRYVNGGNSDE